MNEMITSLKEAYDLQTCKEIIEHGCVSGVCHNHIYYSQTSSFYDMYEAEVLSINWDNKDFNSLANCLYKELES